MTNTTLATADDLGILSGALEISSTFEGTDRLDYYRFTLAQNSDLAGLFEAISLTGLRIISDRNENGIVENNEIAVRSSGSSTGGFTSFFAPLPAGTYFLEVSTQRSDTSYELRLAETPKPSNISPDPGNTLSQAFDLGMLPRQRILRDYVGDLDPVDYYTFTLTQKSNFAFEASGQTANTTVLIGSDRNGNGIYDNGETVGGFNFGVVNGTTYSQDLSAGTYILFVGRNASAANSTHYTLALTTTPDFSGDDILRGTARADRLNGQAGNDRIFGLAGNDVLIGGTGNDLLLGGPGSDRLVGASGDDILRGGADRDTLLGGTGNDQLFGDAGNDILNGDAGNDRLDGGSGNDLLQGGSGNDVLIGGTGNDRLDGGIGNDVITTGGGRDRIVVRRQGRTRVTDFQNNLDKFELIGIRFNQLSFEQRQGDVIGKLGRNTLLVLDNTRLATIDRTDFV
ncbi:calcium-binding protein [Leptolyngbya sp. CCY15150]|uniref:calcium-binding protein n=1 Tax=Leptolyngbya sp. CCY15150 TaxID=2767772 RepID=UPI0023B349A1|nr:calcium-binding protein [Leptolyngbya sp. CCY15150]